MTITPTGSDGFIFDPPVILFENYLSKSIIFVMSVTNDVTPGDYTIKFQKEES
jgi:hypothetical protein